MIFVHNSRNRCDRTVRFVAYAPFLDTLVMIWRNKKIDDKKCSLFAAVAVAANLTTFVAVTIAANLTTFAAVTVTANLTDLI